MLSLQVDFDSETSEQIPLEKGEPISIGSHTTSDIIIDDDGIGALHSRIGWTKEGFEIAVAGSDPINVDGTDVSKVVLKGGMVIRIGSVDITVIDDKAELLAPESLSTGLKPISEEELPDFMQSGKQLIPKTEEESKARNQDDNESSSKPKKLTPKKKEKPADPLGELFDDYDDDGIKRDSNEEDEEEKKQSDRKKVILKNRNRRAVRPGEQEIIKSPVVLGLSLLAGALFLTALVYAFLNARNASQLEFDAAKTEREAGNYTQSYLLFKKFTEEHPRHKLNEEAEINRDESAIEQTLSGASPNWEKSLESLKDYIENQRDSENFAARHPRFVQYAIKISQGAAKSAGQQFSTKLLEVSDESKAIIMRYQPKENPLPDIMRKISVAYRTSSDAILKNDTITQTVADIDAAISAKDSLLGLRRRQELLLRYPDVASNKKIQKRLENLLILHQTATVTSEISQAAQKDDLLEKSDFKVTSISTRTRSRSNASSIGRNVFAMSNGTCFGVDAITGETVWRRVLGQETAFFPISVDASSPSLLMFDSNSMELLLIQKKDGKLTWRQKLPSIPSNSPIVHQGRIYLPTVEGSLWRINLESGDISAKMEFPQSLACSPVITRKPNDDSQDQYMICAGNEGVLYTISLRPWECVKVSFLGHQPGSIKANLLRMGNTILLCENTGTRNCLLTVIDSRTPTDALSAIAKFKIQGSVFDTPLLRGQQLFVPSRSERITVFTVSDDPAAEPLTQVSQYQVEGAKDSRISLTAGPDGKLWMNSSAVRKFQLTADGLIPDDKVIAEGVSAQPLSYLIEDLFIGRHVPPFEALFFSQANRSDLSSQWQSVLGIHPIALQGPRDEKNSTMTLISENGSLFRVGLSNDAFQTISRPSFQIQLPKTMEKPLKANQLSDGRIAIWTQESPSNLWILNESGQVQKTLSFDKPIQASPEIFENRIVVPLEGRLQLPTMNSGDPSIEDFLLKFGDKPAPIWKSLHQIDATHLLTVDSQGTIRRLEYRTTPKNYWHEISMVNLGDDVKTFWDADSSTLAAKNDELTLQIADSNTLESKLEIKLDESAIAGPWIFGNKIYVQSINKDLIAWNIDDNQKPVWKRAISGTIEQAPLIVDSNLILSTHNGELWAVDSNSGDVKGQKAGIPKASLSPLQIDQTIILPTIDGSLYQIQIGELLETTKEGADSK